MPSARPPKPPARKARPEVRWGMGLAALIAWLLTAGIGGYMLRTWVARGGLRRQRATGVGVPPGVVFGHAGAALAGLAVWISYLSSGWRPLAWIGVALVCPAICPGIGTVTLWTPSPVRPVTPAAPQRVYSVPEEMFASLLAEPSPPPRRNRVHLLPLIPLAHGFGALTTFLLTVTAALLPVR